MLPVPRRIGIIARRHRVGIAPASVPALDADFAAAKIADRLLGRLFGLALGAVNRCGALISGATHSPSAVMRNNVLVAFAQLNLLI